MEKGFTLMEVLVAMFILSIAFLVFANIFANQFTNITVVGKKNEALYHTQEKIEHLHATATNLEKEIENESDIVLYPLHELKIDFPNGVEVTSIGSMLEVSMDYQNSDNQAGLLSIKTWVGQPSGDDI